MNINYASFVCIGLILGAASCAALSSKEKDEQFDLQLKTAADHYDKSELQLAANMARKALSTKPNEWRAQSVLGMSLNRIAATTPDRKLKYSSLNEAVATFEAAEKNGARNQWQIQFGCATSRAQRAQLLLALIEDGRKQLKTKEAEKKRPGVVMADVDRAIAKINSEIEQYQKTSEEDLREAADRFVLSLKKDPNYLETLEHLQVVYSLSGPPPKSIEWGEKAAAVIQDQRQAIEKFLQNPNVDATIAMKYRSDLQAFDIKEANCRSLLALMRMRQENYDAALLELNRVMILDPNRPDEYYNRGLCRQKIGDHSSAARDFEQFIRKSGQPADSSIVRDAWDRIAECKKQTGGSALAR
ncbi:MAG: tetratricopeptide repeat protein [Planctomycetes bacterium]|nr:tetratricopeptide repeat protein [Planctomycetota bacterium]